MEADLQDYFGMKTLTAWIKAHPGIDVLAFERNHHKSFGFGEHEEVCGFCLASHYFDLEPPEFCKFCRAPIQNTFAISDLPEIVTRIYNFSHLFGTASAAQRKLPFIVRRNSANKSNCLRGLGQLK
jgi:hypothetical protein